MPDIKHGNKYTYRKEVIEKSVKTGTQIMRLSYNTSLKFEHQLVGNLATWYDHVRDNPKCVASVNLNDPFFHAQAEKVATRALAKADDAARLDELFRLALQRAPTAEDREVAAAFLTRYSAVVPGAPPADRAKAAWAALARVLLEQDFGRFERAFKEWKKWRCYTDVPITFVPMNSARLPSALIARLQDRAKEGPLESLYQFIQQVAQAGQATAAGLV